MRVGICHLGYVLLLFIYPHIVRTVFLRWPTGMEGEAGVVKECGCGVKEEERNRISYIFCLTIDHTYIHINDYIIN